MVKGCNYLICLCIIAALSSACTENEDESTIAELAVTASTLAEKRDIGGLEKLATRDFVLAEEGLDRKGTKWALYRYFRQIGKFSVIMPKPEIEVIAEEESALLRTPVAIGPKHYNATHLTPYADSHMEWIEHVGPDIAVYQLEASLVKERDLWFVQTLKIEKL